MSSKSLRNPSTCTHKVAASSSSTSIRTCEGCNLEDIDAVVGSQEKKLVATMKKSAASRAALKRFRSQSTRRADHARSAMTSSNATFAAATYMMSGNARCSSMTNEMRSVKRQKAAINKQDEAWYDSIISDACLIMGGRK